MASSSEIAQMLNLSAGDSDAALLAEVITDFFGEDPPNDEQGW